MNDPNYKERRLTPVETTKKICRAVGRDMGLAHFPSPLYSVIRNQDFPPGMTDARFRVLGERGLDRAAEFVVDGRWMTFDSLLSDYRTAELGRLILSGKSLPENSPLPGVLFEREDSVRGGVCEKR